MARRSFFSTLIVVAVIVSMLAGGCSAAFPVLRPAAPAAAPAAGPASDEAAAPASEATTLSATALSAAATEVSAAAGAYEAAPPAPAASVESAYAPRPDNQVGHPVVTAGVVDDNAAWADYLDYLDRHTYVWANQRDVRERYLIHVVDSTGRAVHDATVQIYVGDTPVFAGRTDTAGRAIFHPAALADRLPLQQAAELRVVAAKGYSARSQTFRRYDGTDWTLAIDDAPRSQRAQLDLVFLVDATGSMGDEIGKLKSSMAEVAGQIARLPEQPDVRYGLVVYRDQGDDFVVRTHDFTPSLGEFQYDLANVYADGGGDTPEAVNEAVHRTLNDLRWRGEDTVRLVILVGDAPPHLDYTWEAFSYDTDMIDAVRRGIKLFPVGASNIDEQGEYIFRQLAQFTGGKFVFLTYEDANDPGSGPGTETTHDVENYSVSTLDKLIVKLVREELAPLSAQARQLPPNQVAQQPSPVPPPTPTPTQRVNLQTPVSAGQLLPVLCLQPEPFLSKARVAAAAGVAYEQPAALTGRLPAALLSAASDGDILCASTLGPDWRMADTSLLEDNAIFIAHAQPFWAWDGRNGRLMQATLP